MAIVSICPTCHSNNNAEARRCWSCGSDLPLEPAAPGEARKVVTVLFSDVTGSTVLGDELDPESLRRLMGRYFQEMKDVLQRHGGTTEKFIGDAVMAVFGVPRLHEDDALRAVRAAVEMRDVLHGLNDEFERTWGVRIMVRTGVNTGEVIAGDPSRGESFVVGDAVNVAARLEQAAEPDQILIGENTHRLVRDAVTADPLEPLSLKGKPFPVVAWRLHEVAKSTPGWARRLDAPLVGRDGELGALREAFKATMAERSCRLVTVMAPAGVGKSRLAGEFLATLEGEIKILSGRCLPYGEGITFWPIVDVIRDAIGLGEFDSPEEPGPKLLELLESTGDAEIISDRLSALLGLSDVAPGIQETFWAVRKLFEQLAARSPLVVVFEDIHWGEATFLDLIEYLVDWIHGLPVLLVCLARPELLEIRGAWMTGKDNASLISLRALSEEQTEGLIEQLLGGAGLVPEVQSRIADVTEGNPLFVEETIRMLVDDGLLQRSNGHWTVGRDMADLIIPPTIHALLTARLDRLDEEERAVIETASVVGRVFWWGAVSELSTEERRAGVGSALQSLTRKELVSPDRSDLREEDAFRFTHILVRDAAYSAIPKSTRARLHERFADWVQTKTQGRAGEYEEIIGYHLERAYRSLSELGPLNERTERLGRRGAVPLASAGRRAFSRGDMPAAVNLLSRAVSLLPGNDPERLKLSLDLGFALNETGDLERLKQVTAETKEAARTSSDPALQADAVILDLWVGLWTDPEGWAEEAYREGTRAIEMFEQQQDERGLAKGWSLLGLFHIVKCEFGLSETAWEKAAAHAHAAGDEREELEYLSWVPICVWGGPTPTEQGIRRCQNVLDRSRDDRKATSTALFIMGKLEAMRGRFAEARDLIERARSILQEVALTQWMAGPLTQMGGWVEILAGDPAAAERVLISGAETLREIGELSWFSTLTAILAQALYDQDRLDEAEQQLEASEKSAGSDDVYSQSLLRSIRAKVLARRGAFGEAETVAREGLALVEPTDFLFVKSFALLSLGEVLHRAQQLDEATAVLNEALRVCEQKGYTVGADRARQLLATSTAS